MVRAERLHFLQANFWRSFSVARHGAVVGAGATGAGYEYNAYRQMQQLEEDYKTEKISRAEYEKRKQQIEAGSIIY
jgi:hypothetical protein